MFTTQIKKAIQEFSYRNFNSVVVFKERDLKSFQINNPERPYFYESMYRTSTEDQYVVQTVLDEYFILPSELKRTFYKTWEEIAEKTRTELLIDQIIHYWDFDANSIPNDNVTKLPDEIQAFAKEIKVIKALNFYDFVETFRDYIYNSSTIQKKDIELIKMFIKPLFEYTQEDVDVDVDEINSKELKNVLYDVLDVVPQDAEEFMRYLVFRLTGDTLLIKNRELIEKLINSDRRLALDLLIKYTEKSEDAYIEFAKIFNRYKPFFLALKNVDGNINLNPVINKISKLSKKHHMPKVTSDYMRITEGIFTMNEVKEIIKDLDTVYLIKLYNAVMYRILNPKVLVYQVRNGKVFIKENANQDFLSIAYYEEVKKRLLKEITERIQTNVKEFGISFKNRDKVNLCVPTSGKQFVGNFPFYSSFYIDWERENAYVGIYWKNTETERVDLDLSLTNEKQKLGWNSDYSNNDAVYSGDITDAPNGAVEAFKINSGDNFYNVNVNEYSGPDKMDFKLFIGKDNFSSNNARYGKEMFENTSIPFSTKLELESRQQNIGFVVDNSLVLCNLRISSANVSDIQSEDVIDSYKKLIQSKLKFFQLELYSVLPQDAQYILDFENPDKDLLMKLVK